MLTDFVKAIRAVLQFLKIDIWRIRLSEQTARRSWVIRQLRVLLLAIREFDEDKCQLRASALTFYTLLSLVPVAAMAFGVAKGFGFEGILEKEMIAAFPNNAEVVEEVIGFSRNLLERTQGGLITGIGIVVLFWTIIKVLGNIERSFNDIWGVKEDRSFSRKLGDYLSVMLIAPILVILSSGMTVAISGQLEKFLEGNAALEAAATVIAIGMKILPYCIIWTLFSFIYLFMPNLKVRLSSGIMAGILAGTIYQLTQWGYINFQIGVSKFGAIYGSFAALPLFLVWLQVSWIILLFGAEISFAHQNVETYEFEPDCMKASKGYRQLIALAIAHRCMRNFVAAEPAMSDSQLAHVLGVPIRLVRDLIGELIDAGILIETQGPTHREHCYQPAVDSEKLTIDFVLTRLDHAGFEDIPILDSAGVGELSRYLQEIRQARAALPANIALAKIADGAPTAEILGKPGEQENTA